MCLEKRYYSVMFDSRRNFLAASDEFDLAFSEFVAGASRFRENFNKRIHTVDESHISPRLLNHWIKNGLIEDERPDGRGWHRFSPSDILWVKILLKLRGFGVPIEILKQVKRELEGGLNATTKRPLLEFYIAYTFFEKKPARILVFSSGEALVASQDEINVALEVGTIVDDFISIDINQMLGENGVDVSYINDSRSNLEKAISAKFYNPEVKKVTVESKAGKYVLEATHLMENRNAALAAKQLHDFCTLRETVHNGNSRFELTTSKHIKK